MIIMMSASLLPILAVVGTAILHGTVGDGPELPLPCRAWRWPCFDQPWRCTTEEAYQRFILGPQLGCHVYNSDNGTNAPPGDCVVVDGECNFTESASAVSCRSWLPVCDTAYRCATEREYAQYLDVLAVTKYDCPTFGEVPPPTGVCTPINGSCQWYNPCRMWKDVRCSNGLVCGSHIDYWQYKLGPSVPCSSPVAESPPLGPCLLQGECQWSECTSWLSRCGTHWTCGSEYEYHQFLAPPPPPCPYPGDHFQTPDEPGECRFNVSLGACQYSINETCPEGMQWSYCGTPCPLTCDNYYDEVVCAGVCIPGCFCPEGMVEHGGTCILPSDCPINPCAYTDCAPYYSCRVSEITGNAVCDPSCEWNNGGCLEGQICGIEEYDCGPQPCDNYRNIRCTNPLAVECSSACPRGHCCMKLSGHTHCLPSCYVDNGGCRSDQYCIVQPVEYSECIYGLESCSTVQCIDKDDVEGQCIPGKSYQDCGSECGGSCDVYVKQELFICAAVCYSGCFCPSGLVRYRERCVDPLECWSLLNDPPSIDVLPLPKGTILLELTIVGVTQAEFANQTDQFVGSVWTVLDGYRANTYITFNVYAVLDQDSYLLVYLMLEDVPKDLSGDQLASALARHKDTLTVDVIEVSAVEGPTLPSEEDDEDDELPGLATAGIIVAASLLVVAVVVVVTAALVCLCVHSKRNTHSVKVEESQPKVDVPVTYSKLQEIASLENDYVEQPQ